MRFITIPLPMRVLYQCQSCNQWRTLQNMYFCQKCRALLCDSASCVSRALEYHYCPVCFYSCTLSELPANHYKSPTHCFCHA